MNVITVRQGDKFGPEYTTMLGRMVREHSSATLLVLGDGDDANIPLTQGYKSWHAKLELFRPDLEPFRPFLFFDLDTFIVAPIQDMIDFEPDELTLIRDVNRPKKGNSGIMAIPAVTDEIWAKRHTDCADGDYLHGFSRTYLQDLFPRTIFSYKNDCKDGPKGRCIMFHGYPKPHETDGWARELWDSYTRTSTNTE